MTRAALAVLAIVLAPGTIATLAAETRALPDTSATLELAGGFTPVVAPGLIAGYRTAGGTLLAVTRAQVPNIEAWRATTRDAYVDQIERGAMAALPGARRLARRLTTVHGVPALDLELRRTDGAVVVIRILLHRTYALALALEVPRGSSLAEARAITASFAPAAR